MTERDDFEDVLSRYRPVGPSASMRPPAELLVESPGPRRPAWRTRIAAGVMVTAMAGGSVWWAQHRESPDASHDEVGAAHAEAVGAAPADSVGASAAAVGGEPAEAPLKSSRDRPYRVGGRLQEPKRTRYVAPVYSGDPGTGVVAILELLVTPEGKVDTAHVLRGQPPYAGEAAEAVREWRYEPIRVRGEAVWVVITAVVWNPMR